MLGLSKRLVVKRGMEEVWIWMQGELKEFDTHASADIEGVVSKRKVHVVLPERYAITKEFAFPFSEYKKVRDAVRVELLSELPGKLEDYLYDFYFVDAQKDMGKVIVVAAKREIVQNEVQWWGSHGSKPVSAGFDFLGAVATFNEVLRDESGYGLKLLIGSNYVVVFDGMSIVFHKSLESEQDVTSVISMFEGRLDGIYAICGPFPGAKQVGSPQWEFMHTEVVNLLSAGRSSLSGNELKVSAVVGVLIMGVLFFSAVMDYYELKGEYSEVKKKISSTYLKVFGSVGIDDPLYNARQKIKLMGRRAGNSYRVLDLLYALARAVGGYGVRIDSIWWNGSEVEFTAIGIGLDVVKRVKDNMDKQSIFTAVSIRSVRQGADKKKVRFVIDADVKE
ncbi:MAG: hypothetical protein J7L41_08755 [Synergistetes bacterium]|nr:hypothetical protein [Synergistota bacterium]